MISRTACSNIISSGWYKLILLRSRTWFYQKSTSNFVLFCFLLQVSINLAKTPYIVRRYWEEVIFADLIIYTYICLVLGHIFICSFGQKSNSHGRPANILFKSSFSYHIWANLQKLFVLITCIAKKLFTQVVGKTFFNLKFKLNISFYFKCYLHHITAA